jgi:cation diffusion facilitator CzcD-associated flavoprotein CzcO
MSIDASSEYEVVVIGAGITGIGAGYYLGAAGIHYVILEARDELGGVWHTHRWPGARCDSDFIKYSLSFRPFLSPQCLQSSATIRRYLHDVAQEFAILPRIRFGTRVMKAVFDPDRRRWTVHTTSGTFTAQFLFNGNGYFSDEPYVPTLPGADQFAGEIVHAAHLEESRTFEGRHVVLVGSGSTAICCAPEIARTARSLVLLQRSPSYIYETSNQAGPLIRLCQQLYALGWRAPVRGLRAYLQLRDDVIFVAFRRFPGLARRFFHAHWCEAVGEDAVRRHFNPSYNPWEQRIAIAIGLKEGLRAGRIAIKTDRIQRFTATSIVLGDGQAIECDVCVLATGLNLRFFNFELRVRDATVPLDRINFHGGLLVGGIPNYFHPVGSWHSAWTQRSEPLTRLAIHIMRYMREHGYGTVSVPRREVPCRPGITPNYVQRVLTTMPRLEGTTDLPSIDNLLTRRFRPERYQFC